MADETTERIRILLDLEQEAHDRAARQSAREIVRLEKSYDPLSRAVVKLEREERQLAKALERGTITQARHNELLQRAQVEYRQTAQAVESANTVIARSQQQAGGVAGAFQRNSQAFQQLGYQVGDFAVQVGNGTSAFVAFGQQGSQLLGVLGPIGALMGAAVAIAAPMAAAFFSMGEEGEDAAKKLDAFTEALDQAQALAQIAATPIDDLRERFGEFADEVQRGAQIAAQAAISQAMRELSGAVDPLRDGLDEAARAYDRVSLAQERLRLRVAEGADDLSMNVARRGLEVAQEAAEEAAEKIGITAAQAYVLNDALAEVAAAKGPREVVDATAEALELFDALFSSAQDIPPEVMDIATELQKVLSAAAAAGSAFDDMGDAASRAADEAARTVANLNAAAQASFDRQNQQIGGGRGQDPRIFTREGAGEFDPADDVVKQADVLLGLRKPSRGGGRRGGRKKDDEPFDVLGMGREQEEKLRQQLQMLGETAGKVAELSAKYTMLARAKREGIDLDRVQAETGMTVREAIDQQAASIGRLTTEYDQAKERAEFFERQNEAVKDGILDAIVEGENLADTLRNVAKAFARAALEAALFNSGPLSGGSGGLLGGLLGALTGPGMTTGTPLAIPAAGASALLPPSLDGGGYTGNRARIGGIDGKGGFPAILHPQETVIDHTRRPQMSSGKQGGGDGGAVSINITVSGARGNAEIEEMVQRGVVSGLGQYDRRLPDRVRQIEQDPRMR